MASPSNAFNIAPKGAVINEVDVKIIGGVYVPCRSCHWRNVCVVPRGQMLPKLKQYFGDSDIKFHDRFDGTLPAQVYYHCLEFTTIPRVD